LLDEVIIDRHTNSLSRKKHRVSFARNRRWKLGVFRNASITKVNRYPDSKKVQHAGLVLVRQRPGTVSGIVFTAPEDETGIVDSMMWSAGTSTTQAAAGVQRNPIAMAGDSRAGTEYA
jgi:error-prone DNA polymerase